MFWNILTAIATLGSTVAYIITLLYIRAEMKGVEKDRYLNITGDLFAIWQSREFMDAQLWLLHRLEERTWEEFVDMHRADVGELAFHRVGAFYDRVGTLVRLGLINDREILATMGGYAIAVWEKIEPLVHEARKIENSVLFSDFERMLPSCYECYVPALGEKAKVTPFSVVQPKDKISPTTLKRRLAKGDPLTVLDVRQAGHVARDPRTLPGAIVMPPDTVETRYAELPPDREVVVYCA